MKTKWMWRTFIGAGAVVALYATRATANATVITMALPDNCVWCHEDCVEDYHKAGDGGMSLPENWTRNGGAHLQGQCESGGCDTKHGPESCTDGGDDDPVIPQGDDADALIASLRTRDIESFRRLALDYPKSITVNASRGAVQIVGCNGVVVAHLPMDERFIASVTE